ncbi:MAG: starvation-sensing protein RspA [candidate division KSB1 bacterium]|nr:starvation-sensing protein RspA [candidate division KSB1 bacterium]MDZ7345720.1 starvation-sensing protein RspA [candidate division KSB1 bacterium]
MTRRQLFGRLGAAGTAALLGRRAFAAAAEIPERRGLPELKITDVKAITTAPSGIRLTVVKVETSEPGLYGLGCATFNQRTLPVAVAVDQYLKPFAVGRSADNIEDLWQNAYTSSYWRNGPVLNNALSGLDQALWDIKGKRAGMPVYQLLGGKCRFAVDTYAHCNGRDFKELEEDVKRKMAEGYRHVRIQLGGYGAAHLSKPPDFRDAGFGDPRDGHMDVYPYIASTVKMFEHIRKTCGDEIELLHDIHERIPPIDAINLCKQLEEYRPFFIEDPFPPEANAWFKQLRAQTSVPIAMGELFNNPHEWIDLIVNRCIDFIRVHISQIGGLTPARKLAALAEAFQVRTAWHGPGDVSPVGHAANIHLDLAVPNFGIQERVLFDERTQEVFPGCPYVKNGYLYVNEAPGWGVDINEAAAAKYPLPEHPGYWNPIRRRDGTAVRP